MNLLVTGASGQLGRELGRLIWPAGTKVVKYGHKELDIADHEIVEAAVTPLVDAVINAAAYTSVDRAESERESAWGVNVEGPAVLADRCAALGIPLIHFSTDYVFDGKRSTPYREDDEIHPLNHYGATKLRGEVVVRERLREHIIVRTASVFSEFGSNFVKAILRIGAERRILNVVSDQHSCPTPARDLAATVRVILAVIARGRDEPWGTYHFCGQPPVTWFDFAGEVFKAASEYGLPPPELRRIRAGEYPGAAARPQYSAMDCTRISETFGVPMSLWADRLPPVVAAIVSGGQS